MSAGHHPKRQGEEHLLDAALADPKVKQKLARGVTIDKKHDVPYLGGISRDGRTVYIDRHLPASLKLGKLSMNPVPFLCTHERTEHAIMTSLGLKYEAAHKLATAAEHRKLRQRGYDPEAYEAALKPFIKGDEKERLTKVPGDLFLGPYEDSHDTGTLRRMSTSEHRRLP